MSGVSGVELKAAAKKATTWGTAVALGANNGFLFRPTSVVKDAGVKVDDSLGTFVSKDGTPGQIKVEGAIPEYLRYDGFDLFMALFLGIAGAPVQQGASTAYAFAYKWLMSTDGLFATYAKHMKNYIEEHPSLKIAGFTLKGQTGDALEISFNVISQNMVVDSIVNTLTTFNNVTNFEEANRVKFSEGTFRMNDQSAIALASGDKIYPSAFELTATRKLRGVYGQYKTAAPNVQDLIDEPTNDGPPEIKLKLTFPRHTSVTYLSALGADTRKKFDMSFTGGLIASTYYRNITLPFPHLQMLNDKPADAAGIIQEPLEFLVHGASIAPAGMTGITDPFWVTGINRLATDPLA
jgi:hypothetical protein